MASCIEVFRHSIFEDLVEKYFKTLFASFLGWMENIVMCVWIFIGKKFRESFFIIFGNWYKLRFALVEKKIDGMENYKQTIDKVIKYRSADEFLKFFWIFFDLVISIK